MSLNLSLNDEVLSSDDGLECKLTRAAQVRISDVNDILSHSRPGEELKKLHALKAKLNANANAASEQIKDIVFDNYRQFIENSKEVSGLERQIYDLSAMLTEQKTVIESLIELCGQEKNSSCSASIHSAGQLQQNPLQTLMHKVDGVADVLNNLRPEERVLLQSEATLLSGDSMEPLHPVFLVLLSETFLVCYPNHHSGSKLRFTLTSSHRLDSVAVVNVKRAPTEQPYAELIMQLLIFPDQLYLKCESARAKKQWLEVIESAKRSLQREKNLHRQATIRAKRRRSSVPHPDDPRARLAAVQPNLAEPIHETDADEDPANAQEEDLDWLRDIVNDLQEEISHRHMSGAVELLLDWRQCSCRDPDLNAQFVCMEKQVINMLSDEIKRPGALHGGANALHRPLSLLKQLGKAAFAVDLYLKRRSAALSARARDLTISEEPLWYVRHITELFINDILAVVAEFKQQPSEYCLVMQWACAELSLLLSLIRRHVLEVASTATMAVLTNAWRILTQELDRLSQTGLDLSFEVNRLLAPALRSALEYNFTNIIDSTRLRIKEERWRPYNLETESNLNRYLEEMSDLALSIDWAVAPDSVCSLNLAQSACEFARVARSVSRDLSLLKTSGHLHELSDNFMRTLWSDYCELLSAAPESFVHAESCRFIVNQVIPWCEETYRTNLIQQLLVKRFPGLLQYKQNNRAPAASDEEEDV